MITTIDYEGISYTVEVDEDYMRVFTSQDISQVLSDRVYNHLNSVSTDRLEEYRQ